MRRWGGIALLALLAGCVSGPRQRQPLPPPPVEQWPEDKRIQKLPGHTPARPKPAPVKRPTAVRQPAAAWEARKAGATATEIPASTYVVVAGDNLGRIAEKTGAGLEAIAGANGIAPPYPVRIGQRLNIPGGRYHRIQRGQSGIAIARAYGVSWSRIVELNQLEPPYVLREGGRLLIPGKTEVAAMSMEQRASAFQINIDDIVTGGEPAETAQKAPVRPAPTPRTVPPPTTPVAEPASFAGRFLWPLKGAILRPFGTTGDGRRNDGINIAARKGDPVMAAADGTVAYAGEGIAIFGGLVLLRHGDGWITAYGNCDSLLVARGQAVKKGQIIARAGDTGQVSEPQLHFEIRQGRKPVNPIGLLN
ncbi:M23 family metallopeptidase [Sphingomonas naphthae]|uniref:M23 family metallopeptidase n=1 Tax=Sphingomonas naphthae TaxID=1813468 RepID=A0ABY7TNH4_9SPHN|nr:M23 family metallopeptidase [Sphingomonas naphthae]WCT74217.1 M23 family metallopeptidase [Sphingomonas naphthae]